MGSDGASWAFLCAFFWIKWKNLSLSAKLCLTLHSFLKNNLKRMVYEISSYYK